MAKREYRAVRRGPAWRQSFAAALSDPESLVKLPAALILKRNARSTVALITLEGVPLAVKIFNEARLDRRLLRWLAGSAAWRVGLSMDRLQAAGFAVPSLVAVLNDRDRVRGTRSCVLTSALGGGGRADRAWERLGRAERREFARRLGEYVRRLHQAGFYPQDLRADNIFAVAAQGVWTFVLVDLDRVREYHNLRWSRRVKNLVQIERSLGRGARRTEKLRFMRAYRGAGGGEEERRMVAEILRQARRKDTEYDRRRARITRAAAGALRR